MRPEKDIVAELRRIVGASSQRKAAQELGVSVTYINAVLSGKMRPGPKLYSALGYRRVTAYERN